MSRAEWRRLYDTYLSGWPWALGMVGMAFLAGTIARWPL